MDISTNINKNSYEIVIDGRPFKITYPKNICLGDSFNKPLLQNIAFSQTWFLGFKTRVNYDFPEVLFKDFILKTCSSDIPTIADDNNMDTEQLQNKCANSMKNLAFKGKADNEPIFDENFSNEENAVLLLSFGKDSLLSFGLAREIGLNVSLFFDSDTINEKYEFNKKKEIARKFQKEFQTRIYNIDDYTDLILPTASPKYLQDFQGSPLILYYSLLTIPLCYREKTRYIIAGNEQNFNDPLINKDGFTSYATADQTSKFMKEASDLINKFTGQNQQLVSLIEPIYNLFEIKLLYSRYPNLLGYIMSCSNKDIKGGVWCYKCPMCAKTFLYVMAINGNLEKINFKGNLFNKESAELYPLFSTKPPRIYERPVRVRDEQLLAFYMAYKNNAKGPLIEKFKELYLKEAEERYEELYKRFFGIHPSPTMPNKLKQKVSSIYNEELNKI